MADIVISGNTSGSVTLRAPDIAGSPILTLPTTTGTLVVTGGAQTIEFAAGSAASPSITFTGDTNTGIFSPTADTVGFTTGGSERMRITSIGQLYVNTTNWPTSSIGNAAGRHIFGGSNSPRIVMWNESAAAANNGSDIYIGAKSGTSATSWAGGAILGAIANGSDDSGYLTFSTTRSDGANLERMRLNSTGALVFAGGTTTADGIGITFPATQSASSNANTLDDYEEGTWTPTITRNSSNPTVTYGTQNGQYVKIGRIVYASCNVSWSANTGGSGVNWFISGLPFTNSNIGAGNYAQGTIQDFSGITFTVNRTQFGGYVNTGETRFFLCSGGSAQFTDNITVGASGYMYMSVVYIASA